MRKFFRNENKILVILLAILGLVIVGLVVGIIVVNANKGNSAIGGGAGGPGDSGQQSSEAQGESSETEVFGGENAEQLEIREETQDTIRDMPREEALKYLDKQIADANSAETEFSMRMTKINMLYNEYDFSGALKEAKKIENVDELSLQEKRVYYNIMRHIYTSLGDEEEADRYGKLWVQVYDELFDGGEVIYE